MPPATGPTTLEGRLARSQTGESLPACRRPVGPLLLALVLTNTGPMPEGVSVEVLSGVFVRAPVVRATGGLAPVSCRGTSQEQKSGIFPRDLTTPQVLSMMVKSSARRRHGPARDVLRTNVPVPTSPHRGPAGARPQEPEEASRPLSPTQSALVQAARLGVGNFDLVQPGQRCGRL